MTSGEMYAVRDAYDIWRSVSSMDWYTIHTTIKLLNYRFKMVRSRRKLGSEGRQHSMIVYAVLKGVYAGFGCAGTIRSVRRIMKCTHAAIGS